MGEAIEKKTAMLLDEQDEEQDEALDETEGKPEEPITDPGELLRKLCKGTLKLMFPFRAHGQDVEEIGYDFCELTGAEMIEALDGANVSANNIFAMTNAQALALFAATAQKCAPMIEDGSMRSKLFDAKDIKKRLSAVDSVKAIQLAKLFYNASGQTGSRNISKS